MTVEKDVIELIHLYALQPEVKTSVIPGFVKLALDQRKKTDDVRALTDKVWDKVTSDEYLKQFVPLFEKEFTSEEINYILSFYRSEAMKKLQGPVGKNFFMSIFNGFNTVIKEVIDG